MKILMILIIANQIELHSENLQGNACIVGTRYIYTISNNLGEAILADYPVRSILSGK